MSSSVEPVPFDLARYQDPLTIQRVLLNANNVAIVGLSSNELRASNFVGYYLMRHGYRVFPVNPQITGEHVHGEYVWRDLAQIGEVIDMVDIFRRPDAAGR